MLLLLLLKGHLQPAPSRVKVLPPSDAVADQLARLFSWRRSRELCVVLGSEFFPGGFSGVSHCIPTHYITGDIFLPFFRLCSLDF